MEIWNCPSCFEYCEGPGKLIEHLRDYHIYEGSKLSLGIKALQTHSTGIESDVDGSNDEIQYICPFPNCVNTKRYSSKYNLLRHFFDHSTYTKQDRLPCPNCNKRQKTLGSLTRHWDKSCKKRFGRHGCITAEQQHLLRVLNGEKKRAAADMNAALRERAKEGVTRKPDSTEVNENWGLKSNENRTNESVELTLVQELSESVDSDAADEYTAPDLDMTAAEDAWVSLPRAEINEDNLISQYMGYLAMYSPSQSLQMQLNGTFQCDLLDHAFT